MRQAPLLAILLLVISNCQLKPKEEKRYYGTWMGRYIEYVDKHPFAVIYDFLPEGELVIASDDEIELPWHATTEGLQVDTTFLPVSHFSTDSLVMFDKNRRVFAKLEEKHFPRSIPEISEMLVGKSWKSEEANGPRIMHFQDEKVIMVGGQTRLDIRCWKIIKYKDYAFIQLNGNREDCSRTAWMIMQIVAIDSEKISIKHFNPLYNGGQSFVNIETDEKRKTELANHDFFQYCTGYSSAQVGNPMDIHEKPGSIAGYFLENYKTVDNGGTGYVNLRFTINCNGDTGEFSLEYMDEKFQASHFDRWVGEQLLLLGEKLKGWKPYLREGQAVDTRTYLTFKIKNGQLIDVSS